MTFHLELHCLSLVCVLHVVSALPGLCCLQLHNVDSMLSDQRGALLPDCTHTQLIRTAPHCSISMGCQAST